MRTENLHCDLCRKTTTDAGKKLEPLHAICLSLGYSLGGWGSRRNWTPERNYEVCGDCFRKVQEKAQSLAQTIAGLSGNYTISTDL